MSIEELAIRIAIGVAAYLAGALTTHWLNIGRDRRKDRNDLAADLAALLDDEARGKRCTPEGRDLDRLALYLGLIDRRRYARFLSEYRASKQQRQATDSYGQSDYADPARVKHATRALADFIAKIH